MSEEKTGKTEKAEKTKKEAKKDVAEVMPHEQMRREKKTSRWTLALCKRAAGRFATSTDWEQGFPSSYKAAVSHGWLAECTAQLQGTVASTKAPKTPRTRATKLPKSA